MSDSETLMNDLSTCMYRKFRKTLDFSPFLHWRITAIFTEKILIENNSGPDNSSSTNLCSQNVRETRAAIRHSSASAKMSKQSPPFVLPRRESILLRKIPNTRQLITNSIWGGLRVYAATAAPIPSSSHMWSRKSPSRVVKEKSAPKRKTADTVKRILHTR